MCEKSDGCDVDNSAFAEQIGPLEGELDVIQALEADIAWQVEPKKVPAEFGDKFRVPLGHIVNIGDFETVNN